MTTADRPESSGIPPAVREQLANLLFAYELQRRLTESGSPVLSVAAHPGISKTNLVADGGGLQVQLLRAMLQLFAQDAEGGARPTL